MMVSRVSYCRIQLNSLGFTFFSCHLQDRTFWREEIEEMLELDYKLEIEAVACIQKDYLTEVYLKKKIGFHMELYS